MDKTGPDVIIIRRRAPFAAEQPKGGIWKIAHADFMTAMMALFLVLWLINATNQETRTSVAQYFNPVKLSNTTLDRKGVRNPHDSEPGDGEVENANDHKDPGARSSGPERRPSAMLRDQTLQGTAPFEDPYTILAEVAAAKPEPGSDNASRLTLGTTGRPGMNGGEALRDPFDPTFWRQAPPETPLDPTKKNEGAEIVTATIEPAPAELRRQSPATDGSANTASSTAAANATPGAAGTMPAAAAPAVAAALAVTPRPAPAQAAASRPVVQEIATLLTTTAPAPSATSTFAAAIAAKTAENELGKAISEALGKAQGSDKPGVDVRATDEGLLISLTDNVNFGMFAIGSAEPHAETISTMAKIAGLLNSRGGSIVIRGHTDARPFRSRNNDNWRLSTARAHAAQDMLIRGGIDETRIEHVEGHASRKLRSTDPEAAENRRIEILLREKRA